MSRIRCRLLAVLLATSTSSAVAQTTAFTRVSVIPMDRERVLDDHTVVVRDGRIVELGPSAAVPVPADAQVIDGRGKYLIPGLAEMHAHIPPPAIPQLGLGREWVHDVLFLFIANGVTTVRGMLGHPAHLELREAVEGGRVPGPRIWTSGPSVNGNSVQTPDSAQRTPAFQHEAGYDFIKIHPGLTRETFDSLDAAADRVGIPYAGHVSAEVGVERALAAGYATIDHLDRYVEYLAGQPLAGNQASGFFGANLTGDVDEGKIALIARRTAEAGVWNVPTQTLMDTYAAGPPTDWTVSHPELRYVPAAMREAWLNALRGPLAEGPPPRQRTRFVAIRRRLIKALHDVGAGLLLGSDAPQIMNVPGFSAHRELETLVASGLSAYEALVTGTRNVATFFGIAEHAGTLAPGNDADLLLLEANPLTDIRNTTRLAGVMVRGDWWPREAIDERLAALAARYAQ